MINGENVNVVDELLQSIALREITTTVIGRCFGFRIGLPAAARATI